MRQIVAYSQDFTGAGIGRFFQYFYEGRIFEDSKAKNLRQVGGVLLPNRDYRIIFVADNEGAIATEEERLQITKVMKERNIEIYVFRYLAQNPNFPPRDINTFKRAVENRWNFATQIYTTPNLDKNEFEKVMKSWK